MFDEVCPPAAFVFLACSQKKDLKNRVGRGTHTRSRKMVAVFD
jgi:hypothetical protein